jgi:hypothetical protein
LQQTGLQTAFPVSAKDSTANADDGQGKKRGRLSGLSATGNADESTAQDDRAKQQRKNSQSSPVLYAKESTPTLSTIFSQNISDDYIIDDSTLMDTIDPSSLFGSATGVPNDITVFGDAGDDLPTSSGPGIINDMMVDSTEALLDQAVANTSMDAEVVGSDKWLEGLIPPKPYLIKLLPIQVWMRRSLDRTNGWKA